METAGRWSVEVSAQVAAMAGWLGINLTLRTRQGVSNSMGTEVISFDAAWQAAEKRRLPGEKELHARMRVFARYMPQAEHDDLVDALVMQQRLQHRIQARASPPVAHHKGHLVERAPSIW